MTNLKKIFIWIIFLISCIVDIYGFVLLINNFKFDVFFLLVATVSNIILISLFGGLVFEIYMLKKSGNIYIDDIDLTVINQKNLTRKKITDLEVNIVNYTYEFDQNGFDAYIRFKGKVVKYLGSVKGISLNFSGDSNQAYDNIEAYAYDLLYDPNKKNKINGKVNKQGGLNVEVFFKFQHPLKRNEQFDYVFHYRWNNCVNINKDYIAAIPPFKNIDPRTLDLKVIFKDKKVCSFEVYSINNYIVRYEARIVPDCENDNYQEYNYRYKLEEKFNFAVAVFSFDLK